MLLEGCVAVLRSFPADCESPGCKKGFRVSGFQGFGLRVLRCRMTGSALHVYKFYSSVIGLVIAYKKIG